MVTNCRNCGAPIDISRDACAYCDSPYEFAVQNSMLTSNEVRSILYANDEPIMVI